MKKKKNEKKKKYNCVTLLGYELSQVIPIALCSHKSFETFQFKVPIESSE